jgi:hypothetical protein
MCHCAEEDRCVPKLKFGSWELAVQSVDKERSNCTQDEAEWQALIDMLLEQTAWPL